ncbi:MAG: hypothetical protein ACMG57_02575 [Candidatus Dojkabacteria bacterium]
MPKNLVKTLVQYRIVLIIGGFLVFVIVAVLIFSALSTNAKADVRIEVKPILSLGPCFNNQIPPKTTIASPADGTKYTTGDKVTLTGIAVLECNSSKIEEKDLSWYLDTDATPFATGYAYSLEGLKAGSHSIKLVSVSGKLSGVSTITISFTDPKPQVLGIKASPPPAPQPPPNQAPTANITSPKDGTVYNSFQSEVVLSAQIKYFTVVDFSGIGIDPDGDPLTYSWSDDYGNSGTTANTSFKYYVTYNRLPTIYTITLVVTDSKGANSKPVSITIKFDTTSLG